MDSEFREAKWKVACEFIALNIFVWLFAIREGSDRLLPGFCVLVLACVTWIHSRKLLHLTHLQSPTPPPRIQMSSSDAYACLDALTNDAKRRALPGRWRRSNWVRITDPTYPTWRRATIAISCILYGVALLFWIVVPFTPMGSSHNISQRAWWLPAFFILFGTLNALIYFSGHFWDKRHSARPPERGL